MGDAQPISRRDALMATAALGALAGVSHAEEEKLERVAGGLKVQRTGQTIPTDDPVAARNMLAKPNLLRLVITLADGQTVSLDATKAVITSDDAGTWIATPPEIVPVPINRKKR